MRSWKLSPVFIALALSCAAPALAAEDAYKNQSWLEDICSEGTDSAKMGELDRQRADRLAERLKLTDKQKAAYKDFEDTRAKIRADHKASLCTNKPDLSTLAKRLAFTQRLFEDRVADMKAITPKLLAFYDSLDKTQQAAFDGSARNHDRDPGSDHHHRHHHHED